MENSHSYMKKLLKYLVKTQVHKIRCFKKKFRPIVRKIATAKWEKHDDGRVKLHTFFDAFPIVKYLSRLIMMSFLYNFTIDEEKRIPRSSAFFQPDFWRNSGGILEEFWRNSGRILEDF